jgi:metal-responsive CopG/Arc/MetJ family transcriptional regulator
LTYPSYRFILLRMKVAVSVPDRVFEEAEKVSKRLRVSRSRLYAQALEDFVQKHREKSVRAALEEVYETEPSEIDAGLVDLQAHALREKW